MGTTRREQPTSQLRWKRKKKRRRRKRRKNKCFLTFLLRPSDSPSNLLHLKSSISTSTTTTTAHPKQQKTISFHESFVKAKDLVSNRLETLETSRQLLQLHRFLTSKKCFYVFHKSALPKILFFLDFFTHTLLSLYNCDFGTIYMDKNF